MDKEKLEKRAKRLYVLFWFLLIVSITGLEFYTAWQEVTRGIKLLTVPGLFHFTACILMGLLVVSTLGKACRYAKEAGADQLYAKAAKWYRLFLLVAFVGVLMHIVGLFFPGLFA